MFLFNLLLSKCDYDCRFQYISSALLQKYSPPVAMAFKQEVQGCWCGPNKGLYNETSWKNKDLRSLLSIMLQSNMQSDFPIIMDALWCLRILVVQDPKKYDRHVCQEC
eukprot:UN04920